MTMAEFNIRLFAFKRISKNNERLFREVGYSAMIGSHLNPKKIPKDKNKYWKIDDTSKIDKSMIDLINKATEEAILEYKKQVS